jgi:7-cyano-7-deazaguanine synthase
MVNIPSALTDPNLDIEKQAFLPTRNLLFATIGAAYAYGKSSNVIALGLLANPIFPDQTPEFVKSSEACLTLALGRNMRILTPFITMDKRDILRLARKYDLPFGITYYCHSGGVVPCGKCISCKERDFAEEELSREAEP